MRTINNMDKQVVGFSGNRWIINGSIIDNSNIINHFLDLRKIEKHLQPKFINKKYEDLEKPHKILNIDMAGKILQKIISSQGKITLFGDYDADGIPSTALLHNFIEKAGGEVEAIIPDRADGYGLNEEAENKIIAHSPELLITVDNGTSSHAIIERLMKKKIEVIVIDHHEISGKKIPHCTIINPKQKDDLYGDINLTAGGLVFKLIQFMIEKYFKDEKSWETWLKWQLDLVAISTVCDIAPLTGDNRILVDKGIIVLKKNHREAFKYLFEIASIDPETVSVYTIGFLIGPRINATGRMGDSNLSYDFFRSKGLSTRQLAEKLNLLNIQRQDLFKISYAEAEELYAKSNNNLFAILSTPHWSEGILGLIASKITENKYIPSFIFRETEDKFVGSARSIDGINVVDLLEKTSSYLLSFGGHEKAGGLTIKKDQFRMWKSKISKLISRFDRDIFVRKQIVDARLSFELTDSVIDTIAQLEPFGMGNAKPVFFDSAIIESINVIGSQKNHLSLKLKKQSQVFNAVLFGKVDWQKKIKLKNEYLIFYQIAKSNWKGRKVDIIIKDIADGKKQII